MGFNLRKGNMYDWVDATHTHQRGGCPHDCTYCSTKHLRCARYFNGPLYLKEDELKRDYYKFGKNKTIFIEHMMDLFAEGVPDEYIEKILAHCKAYPENQYLFQSKNPGRMVSFDSRLRMPERVMYGTTIETDDEKLLASLSKAPRPWFRAIEISNLKDYPTFVTIEPIMKFNKKELVRLIERASPSWVNIGADSKHNNLQEPTWDEVMELIGEIWHLGIEVREKSNLDRLKR